MKRNMLNRVLSLVLVLSMVMSFAVMPVGATEGEGSEPHVHTWVSGVCSDTTCNATCTHVDTEKTENVTASTCTVAGTKTVTCVCGSVIATETLALALHDYSEETGTCTGCGAQKPTEPQGEEQPAQCSKNAECTATENHDAECPKHPDYVAPVACDKTAECKATENHDAECLKAKADAEAAAAAQAKIDEVNTLINALPEAVTAENYESVMTQLTAIMAYQSTMGDLWAQTNQEKLQAVIAMTQTLADTGNEVSNPVAQVGDQKFADLQDAIVAAAPSGTVTLLGNVTVDKWLMVSEHLSLAGHIITVPMNGLTIDGAGFTLTVKDIDSGNNGSCLFSGATNLNVKNLTINTPGAGIDLKSGTISNVIFNCGGSGVFPGDGEITIRGCTFKTSGVAIYSEAVNDGLLVEGNRFEIPADAYAIYMRGATTFKDNTVVSGKVNVVSGSPVVIGNNFNDVRLKVYNEATASISGNTINNLVFGDETKEMASIFTENTLSETAQTALDKVEPEYVAQIGTGANTRKFTTLQMAFEAAQVSGGTITMLADSNEAITFTQNPGQLITLDGNGKTMTGTIVMAARAGTDGNALFTVQNLNFTTTRTAGRFIQSEETNYYPWIKVTGCTFSGPGANTTVVAVGVKSSPKVIIENCVVSNMHSVLQNTSGWNATVSNVKGSNLAEGLNMGTCQNVVIENCDISANMYAVRADLATVNRTIKITGSKLTSADASNATVIFRKGDGKGKSDITITGNTITAPAGGQWMKDISTTAPCVILTTDEQVDTAAYAAKNGNTYYTHIADAVSALTTKGGTVTLLKNVTEDITITAPADKNAVIDLNGKKIEGGIIANGTVAITGGEAAPSSITFGENGNVILTEGTTIKIDEIDGAANTTITTNVKNNKVVYDETEGVYTIVIRDRVATIGDGAEEVFYESLNEAIEAAQADDVIFLRKAVTENVEVDKNITINLGENLMTGDVTIAANAETTIVGAMSGNLHVEGKLKINKDTSIKATSLTVGTAGAIDVDANGLGETPVVIYTGDVGSADALEKVTVDYDGELGEKEIVDVVVMPGAESGYVVKLAKLEMPTATVTPCTSKEELTFALTFTADEVSPEQLAYFGNWITDFELTLNAPATFATNSTTASGYLSGQFDDFDDLWLDVPPSAVSVVAGEPLRIMDCANELFPGHGFNQLPYAFIQETVKVFNCGVHFTTDYLNDNPNLKVTLSLNMYEPTDTAKANPYVIGVDVFRNNRTIAAFVDSNNDGILNGDESAYNSIRELNEATKGQAGPVPVVITKVQPGTSYAANGNLAIFAYGKYIQMPSGGTFQVSENGAFVFAPNHVDGTLYETVRIGESSAKGIIWTTYYVERMADNTANTLTVAPGADPTFKGYAAENRDNEADFDYEIDETTNSKTGLLHDNAYVQGTNAKLIFKCNGFVSLFKGAYVTNWNKTQQWNLTQGTHYTIKPGCTELTLSNSFLKNLPTGAYILHMVYQDGTATDGYFHVVPSPYVADHTNPKTGDDIFAPAALMLFSVSALAVLMLNKKRIF